MDNPANYSPLPVDAALPELTAALAAYNAAVLVAPPGAGKTTRVPLVLAREPWADDRRILVLEPRRLAARAAAERMAKTLGERVGETVGLRVRFGSKVSRKSRIEVLTEGIFARLIIDDPMLEGVAAVLFDEFHERSLDADLGLALARDVQQGLREDLRLLAMSATIDGARVAKLLGGVPVITAEGRSFPVETRYLGRDPRPIAPQMADAITRAMRADKGSLLAFLPGAAEIRRTAAMLEGRIDADTGIAALYGALSADEQDRAVAPAPPGRRKIVLATSIAETSITIEGVRIVVDSGLSRVPQYEPDVGVTRLDTVRVSRAAADQRRGRAGRTEPGICYRLWDEPQTAALAAFSRPEILAADLSGFALDLAAWGSRPEQLAFLDPPPRTALSEAQGLLRELGAIDEDGRITDEGKRLRRLPLPPRLARMVTDAADIGAAIPAAEIAILIGERGLGGNDIDLNTRLDAFHRDRSSRAREARAMTARWAETAQSDKPAPSGDETSDISAGALLALAFPDRIAKNRGTSDSGGAFLLASGRGAQVDKASALARAPFLAVGELAGSAAASHVLLAAPVTLAEVDAHFADRIAARSELSFVAASASVRLRRLRQWRDRLMFLRAAEDSEWPDLSDAALAADMDWLAQTFAGKTALAELSADEFAAALVARLPFPLRRRLDAEAPVHFVAPTGTRALIDYAADGGPKISIRVQELFGLAQHPAIAGGKVPLLIELLSPAQRPVQMTRDLPGFWRGSYAAVRSEMRGRYPKHPWPEDPLNAPPTRRAKRTATP